MQCKLDVWIHAPHITDVRNSKGKVGNIIKTVFKALVVDEQYGQPQKGALNMKYKEKCHNVCKMSLLLRIQSGTRYGIDFHSLQLRNVQMVAMKLSTN